MTGLQIFKYTPAAKKLPKSNCKECGCATCMVYSLKLAKQQIDIDKCPYVCEELRQNYSQSIKHPQKTIKIGDLKIGGENVLFR
ncbi:acetyl-CoA synthase subunit gamma, partial [bacterium]|nr:acetyl-CoA synthase subunit gamma [bacterium]